MNRKTTIIILALLLLVLSGILVFKLIYNKPHPDYEKLKADYKLPAMELYNYYKTGKHQTQDKYLGKILEIEGQLSNIEKVDTLVIAVFAFESGIFGDEGIRCTMLTNFNRKLQSFSINENIRLKGYCAGYNDTDIILEKCSITEN